MFLRHFTKLVTINIVTLFEEQLLPTTLMKKIEKTKQRVCVNASSFQVKYTFAKMSTLIVRNFLLLMLFD